jgi:hypothetical protein
VVCIAIISEIRIPCSGDVPAYIMGVKAPLLDIPGVNRVVHRTHLKTQELPKIPAKAQIQLFDKSELFLGFYERFTSNQN